MSQDSIANTLVIIKNASNSKHSYVDVPFSKVALEIIKLFKSEGFLKTFKVNIKNKISIGHIRVVLKYGQGNTPVISGIKRVSKSGCRIYKKAKDIPRILNGFGVVVVSTSRGIVTGKRAKEEFGLGGEILCYIW